MEQKEFHEVVSIAEAKRKLFSNYVPVPRYETVELKQALGRVAAETVVAPIDVPPFDRASMDGYAVRASDTFYAEEDKPVEVKLLGYIRAGEKKNIAIQKGECVAIATGAPVPKGANSVVMVEFTEKSADKVKIYKPVAPGENIMAAGSDIMRGETAIREGSLISPRETGVLAALGITKLKVYKKPKVAVLSTGNEIVAPGKKLQFGKLYDVNARAICDSVTEHGGEAEFFGIAGDDANALLKKLQKIMKKDCDVIITSGGTSAGVGDLSYKILDRLGKPGILVHGVAVKPGKPTIIAAAQGKPIFGLPGYPTSALIIFDIFVAPLIRQLAGLAQIERKKIRARAAMRLYSAKGRYEIMLVNLVGGSSGELSAYPILTGSGAITTLAEADGYIEITEDREMIEENSEVEVSLLSERIKPADITIIGSHCVGVDLLLRLLNERSPLQAKVINVGSSGGLAAVKRGEADLAGTHLIDEKTGIYNIPLLDRLKIAQSCYLIRGYDREQGILVARGNPKRIKGIADLLREDVAFMNRNAGSGTRVLLDLELSKLAERMGTEQKELAAKIKGYEIEAKSHTAIAAAIACGRADAGVAIKTVAEQYGLDFIPLREEKYDFAVPKDKIRKPAVQLFLQMLKSEHFRNKLKELQGLKATRDTGKVIHEPK